MNTINLGKVRGNMIYTGGAVVGSSAAGVIFDATGIEKAYEGDIYINLDSSSIYNGNVYECVTPGSPDIAKWIYKGSIRGPKVSTVNNLKSTSTEDALAAYQGTRLFDMMINAGVFSKNVIVDCDQIVYGLNVVIDNVDSVLTLVVGGIEYKYNHVSSGTAENKKISIVLGENIGMPQSGGVINEIQSTEAYIYAYELTDASATKIYSKNIDLWDAINEALLSHEITGQVIDGEETLAMGSIHKFVNGLKKVFYPITHAKAVWFDKANKKTVHDVITEMLSGSDSGNISDEYDENVIYEAGAYCIRENVLYKALGTTTGEFDANMWEACKVDEEIGVLKNDVSELNKNLGYESGSLTLKGTEYCTVTNFKGNYNKIGKLVFINMTFTILGNGNETMYIDCLPYGTKQNETFNVGYTTALFVDPSTNRPFTSIFAGSWANESTSLYIGGSLDGRTWMLEGSVCNTAGIINISGFYEIA